MPQSPEQWSRDVARTINEHTRAIAELRRVADQTARRAQPVNQSDPAKEFLGQLAQQSQIYNQVVAVLGYGGFLTLWASTYHRMDQAWFGVIGFLLAFSLMVFIVTELAKALSILHAFKDTEHRSARESLRIMNDRSIAHHRQVAAFYLAAGPGVLGGLLLIVFYLGQLMGGAW